MVGIPGCALQKGINSHRALGGGWGGGGPNPSPSPQISNPVPHTQIHVTRNSDLEPLGKVAWYTTHTKNHLKKCKLEVRRAFCNKYESISKIENTSLKNKQKIQPQNTILHHKMMMYGEGPHPHHGRQHHSTPPCWPLICAKALNKTCIPNMRNA